MLDQQQQQQIDSRGSESEAPERSLTFPRYLARVIDASGRARAGPKKSSHLFGLAAAAAAAAAKQICRQQSAPDVF